MSSDQIVMVLMLVVTFAAVGLMAEAYSRFADEKASRRVSDERLARATARALEAEAVIREASARRTPPVVRGRTDFDRHVDSTPGMAS
jgi:Tfp pilus assembly protein PilX